MIIIYIATLALHSSYARYSAQAIVYRYVHYNVLYSGYIGHIIA